MAVVADGVDEYIAHVVDVFRYHPFLVEVAVGHHSGSEEVVGNGVYDCAVHLTRHIHIERTRTGNDMGYLQTALLGYDGAAHGGGHVVHHQHYLGGMSVEFLFESEHNGSRHPRMVASADAQVSVGLRHGEVGKERGIQSGVVLRTGVDYAIGYVFYPLLWLRLWRGTGGAIFMKLGRAPDTMVIFIAHINW